MLREELQESDIPHRTTIRKRVEEVLSEHLDELEKEMVVRQLGLCIRIDIYTLNSDQRAKSHLPWICGVTQTYHHSWL